MIKKLRKGYSSIKIRLLGTIGSMFWTISYITFLFSSSLFLFLDVLASFIFTFSIGSVLIGMCVYKITNFSKNINVFIFGNKKKMKKYFYINIKITQFIHSKILKQNPRPGWDLNPRPRG